MIAWKLGDKCQCKMPSGIIITDCEIVALFPKTQSCKLIEPNTKSHWVADLSQLICYHYSKNLGVELCDNLEPNHRMCEQCPLNIDRFDLDEEL